MSVATILATRRAAIESQLRGITTSSAAAVAGGIGFGKRVGEGTAAAVDRLGDVAAHDRLLVTLEQIRRAEAKLAEGTYGRCDVCGGAIPAGRLEARPYAVTCLRHAA